MTTVSDALEVARQFARQISSSSPAPLPASEIIRLSERIAASEHVGDILTVLQQDALACLDQMPRDALGLARVAHELANAGENAAARADCALTLAMVLNRLGEFQAALPLAERAASFFAPRGDEEKAARSFCEAAWANTFIGDLNKATEKIERARATTSLPLLQARCDWIQARVLRGQAQYSETIALLEKARDMFQAARLPLEAARCERELAETYIWSGRHEAFTLLVDARRAFEVTGCILDATMCDLVRAIGLSEAGRHFEALESLLSTREQFADLQADFFAAWCDLVSGNNYRHLNRYDESLQALHKARDYYLSCGIRKDVSACDINLGNTYYALNRYDEALRLYQEAADLSLAESRETRVARIYTNMGLVHTKQGRFSQALDLHYQALQVFTSRNLVGLAAGSHYSIAICHRELGQYAEALAHLNGLKDLAVQHHLHEAFVECNIALADIHLAHNEFAEVKVCLEQARDMAEADRLDSYVAVCDRLLAQATAQTAGREHALARVENARALFLKHAQTVDAALCDLTEGELRLQWNEVTAAQEYFQRARAVLSPAFPDQAWRADYGLGRCAATGGDPAAALGHYLRAVRTIATSRSMLVTEQISNDFFARRQSVFDDALSISLQQDAADSALEVIEASKARTFLTLLQNRDWKQQADRSDPYIAELIARERTLRYQLNTLRGRVAVQAEQKAGEPLRGGEAIASISAAALEELNALSQTYEAVVAQLRLAETGLAGVSVPAPFALDRFRDAANSAFGSDWTALDYYLTEDALTLVVVAPDSLSVERKILSAYDRAILDKCTSSEPDLRELVYRGTLRGVAAPTPGANYLKHLYRLLIPQGLGTTLIISPHGSLHTLPFQALVDPRGDAFLIERHTLLYSPNLQALQVLLGESVDGVVKHPLILGVSNFGDQMHPLPSAAVEVNLVRQAFDGCGESLCEEQATRRKLLELNASGELRKFDVLHFATHAILDSVAPHQSRVLLYEDALTTMDILDLSLNARLVTLSACRTALGKGGCGDELIGLARAFFYAGARAVLATLWHIEDQAMTELTKQFYCNLARGENAAMALRNTQIEMIHAGRPPYQWASFVIMGRP